MIVFHTALHAEARALIQYYKLKREHHIHAFACFRNADYFLIESGVGKVNTATAIGWAQSYLSIDQPVFLNIGIAGHKTVNIGELYQIHRVEDQTTGHRTYPVITTKLNIKSDNLLTLDQPSNVYPDNELIDMEASAFFHSASRFTTLELAQSLKVTSDNQAVPARRMKDKEIEALIFPHLSIIDTLAEELSELRSISIHTPHQDYEHITHKWHFSQYQLQQLKRLLQRHKALTGTHLLLDQIPVSIDSSKQFIAWLVSELHSQQLEY